MAVTQNCLAQNNISTYFTHGRLFSHVANGQVKLQGLNGQTDETNSQQAHFNAAVQKRAVNGILTYIDAAMFCLVPKNWDFKTQISTETWVSHSSGKASPPCSELRPPVSVSRRPSNFPRQSRLSRREEMPWWDAAKEKTDLQVQRRHLQRNCWTKLSCAEITKSGTKQPEELHRFCWLRFCKEVLGSLLKV